MRPSRSSSCDRELRRCPPARPLATAGSLSLARQPQQPDSPWRDGSPNNAAASARVHRHGGVESLAQPIRKWLRGRIRPLHGRAPLPVRRTHQLACTPGSCRLLGPGPACPLAAPPANTAAAAAARLALPPLPASLCATGRGSQMWPANAEMVCRANSDSGPRRHDEIGIHEAILPAGGQRAH